MPGDRIHTFAGVTSSRAISQILSIVAGSRCKSYADELSESINICSANIDDEVQMSRIIKIQKASIAQDLNSDSLYADVNQ